MSSISNLVTWLPHELPNDLRLKTVGNKEILGKSQIWVKTWPSVQSRFQKLNIGNSSQKTLKSTYQTFTFLSSFTGFLYFVPTILSRIVDSPFSNEWLLYILQCQEKVPGKPSSLTWSSYFCYPKHKETLWASKVGY